MVAVQPKRGILRRMALRVLPKSRNRLPVKRVRLEAPRRVLPMANNPMRKMRCRASTMKIRVVRRAAMMASRQVNPFRVAK